MRLRRRSEPEPEVELPAPDEHRKEGPWDVTERPEGDAEADDRAAFGTLSLQPPPGAELRLQVDEDSGAVVALLLATTDGAIDLRLFAAPRNEDIWPELVNGIVAEAKQHGGSAEEGDGPFGTVVGVSVPVEGPGGKTASQPSVIHGIAGPRWLLRAQMFGRPAIDYDPRGDLETALRSVVVNRGQEPMVPGELLPLELPPGAAPIQESGQQPG
jgi:hypothetical protein